MGKGLKPLHSNIVSNKLWKPQIKNNPKVPFLEDKGAQTSLSIHWSHIPSGMINDAQCILTQNQNVWISPQWHLGQWHLQIHFKWHHITQDFNLYIQNVCYRYCSLVLKTFYKFIFVYLKDRTMGMESDWVIGNEKASGEVCRFTLH